MYVKVLGTAQDAGIPHSNCFCPNCNLARRDKRYQRLAASLSIHFEESNKWFLIDPSPDFKTQLDRIQKETKWRLMMDGIFITHAHIGHYTGLMYLGKEAVSTNQMPVAVGENMREFLSSHYPWKQLIDLKNIKLETLKFKQDYQLTDGAGITPLLIPHRNEFSETFGFIIYGRQKRLLYIPDIDRWEQWNVNLGEVMRDIDYCFIDGTFYSEKELASIGRSYQDIPHPLISDSMEIFKPYKDTCQIYFTHFNHTNPVIGGEEKYRREIEKNGFFILEEGHEFNLSD
ncbi:MBL fold metallo-hydrolase [Virgibacillus siamensis]|uniref:MBL fold metallo-hydrolase n=1 Tax=Virgibacillus siamensis TaxID=480071 RepID=UPI0009872434|nr:MBL fold metallo-hydrolase [Virgibacillus siamensis]